MSPVCEQGGIATRFLRGTLNVERTIYYNRRTTAISLGLIFSSMDRMPGGEIQLLAAPWPDWGLCLYHFFLHVRGGLNDIL